MDNKDIISTPHKFFKLPEDLMNVESMKTEEKVTALKNWKNSIIQAQEGENEPLDIHKKNKKFVESDNTLGSINSLLSKYSK